MDWVIELLIISILMCKLSHLHNDDNCKLNSDIKYFLQWLNNHNKALRRK